jgi:phosphate acetyltransferase
MVKEGDADGVISGSVITTAETIRPALQIIKTKEGISVASGVMLMEIEKRELLFADVAVVPEPTSEQLAEIAETTANTAKMLGMEPKIAMLSFSTNGSAHHPLVDVVRKATQIAKEKGLTIDGEMQLDAALIKEIAERKFPGSAIKGDANILIFPNLSASNIGYKLVERLAKCEAIGPIIQGLNKPINDLSRGCSAEDIVDVTAFTVVQAQQK